MFSDHYFLLTPCNLKTDKLNSFYIFTVKTLLEEILHIPRLGRGGGGLVGWNGEGDR